MAGRYFGGGYAGGPAAPSNAPFLTNGAVTGLSAEVDVTATGTAISWARPVQYSTNPSWSAGTAITAGNYEIGRDADATNQMHFNVPTGASWEWSVQDVAAWTLSATAWTHTQAVATSGSPVAWTLTAGAHTTLAAGAEASDVDLNLSRTVQFTGGSNITTQRAVRIRNPTYGFTSATTITNTATVAIDGAPQAGTNATLTNAFSLSIGSGGTVNAANAAGIAMSMDGIAAGRGAMTILTGLRVVAPAAASVSLGNQTATLTNLSSVRLEQITYTGTAATTRAVTNPATLQLVGAPTNTDGLVSFSTGPYGASVSGATTFTQLATSTPAAIDVPSYTVTLAATTQITSVGPAGIRIGTVTIAQSGGAVTVDAAASLYIAGPPAAGGSVTLTAPYAIWADAGNVRFDGSVLIGGATAPETGSTSTLTILSGTAPDAGIADAVIFYSSDNTAGNTIPSFYCEGTEVLATGQADSASSVRVRMRINGTVVVLLAI